MADIDSWFERKTRGLNNDAKAKLKSAYFEKHEEILAKYKSSITTEEAFGQLNALSDEITNEGYSESGFDVIYVDEAHRLIFYADDVVAFDEVHRSVYNWEEVFTKEKISESIVIDESKKVQRIIYDIYKDNSNLSSLTCWEFEEMIAELLDKQGFKVELTQKTKDNGYDIIALMNVRMHNPLKFLVECKRYTNRKVGVDVIRSFKEVIDIEKANRGIIVTTSYFTKGAWDKQREIPYLLDYRDKDKVIEWVKDYFNSFKV
jgi:hypothetical protein